MEKKSKQPIKTCADCIHESACRVWTDGKPISDASANRCPNHETVKESGAYLCGVLDERKRNKTNADRIRAMSDEELAWELMTWRIETEAKHHGVESNYPNTQSAILEWLKQPAEEDFREGEAD